MEIDAEAANFRSPTQVHGRSLPTGGDDLRTGCPASGLRFAPRARQREALIADRLSQYPRAEEGRASEVVCRADRATGFLKLRGPAPFRTQRGPVFTDANVRGRGATTESQAAKAKRDDCLRSRSWTHVRASVRLRVCDRGEASAVGRCGHGAVPTRDYPWRGLRLQGGPGFRPSAFGLRARNRPSF